METHSNSQAIAREDVLLALAQLGEDPTPSRVDAVLALTDLKGAAEGDHMEAVRSAVDTARRELDASREDSAKPDYVVSVYVGWLGDCWLTESSDESPDDLETTTNPVMANRYADEGEAQSAVVAAAKKFPHRAFCVDMLMPLPKDHLEAEFPASEEPESLGLPGTEM